MIKNKLFKKAVPALLGMGVMLSASSTAFAGNATVTDLVTPTDVEVQAKVTASGSVVYKTDIEWGNMKFEYSTGNSWNPDTHTSTGQAGWVTSNSYYSDDNNKITVTNHSNSAIKVNYDYAQDASVTTFDAVEGAFFAQQADALAAVAPGAPTTPANTTTKADLASAVGTPVGSAPSSTVYFSLYGTPKTGAPTVFTKVGNITLTITQ